MVLASSRPVAAALAAAASCLALALAFCPTADAGVLDSVSSVVGAPDALWSDAADNVRSVHLADVNANFESLFADGPAGGAFDVAKSAMDAVAAALGYALLAVSSIAQLVRIAREEQHRRAGDGLRRVAFLCLWFSLMLVVIDNAGAICEAVYWRLSWVSERLGGVSDVSVALASVARPDAWAVDLAEGLMLWCATVLLQAVVYLTVLARGLQLYVYAVFSPVPLSFALNDATRPFAKGFARGYAALCLAGSVIVVVLLMFPAMLAAVLSAAGPGLALPAELACLLVVMYSLVRSGRIARDVLGG